MRQQIHSYQVELENVKAENDRLKTELLGVKQWKKDVAKTLRQNDQVRVQNDLLRTLEGITSGEASVVDTRFSQYMKAEVACFGEAKMMCQTIDERGKHLNQEPTISTGQVSHKHSKSQPRLDLLQ